jgi:hypothetical protein
MTSRWDDSRDHEYGEPRAAKRHDFEHCNQCRTYKFKMRPDGSGVDITDFRAHKAACTGVVVAKLAELETSTLDVINTLAGFTTALDPKEGWMCPQCGHTRWVGIVHHCPTGIVVK